MQHEQKSKKATVYNGSKIIYYTQSYFSNTYKKESYLIFQMFYRLFLNSIFTSDDNFRYRDNCIIVLI